MKYDLFAVPVLGRGFSPGGDVDLSLFSSPLSSCKIDIMTDVAKVILFSFDTFISLQQNDWYLYACLKRVLIHMFCARECMAMVMSWLT